MTPSTTEPATYNKRRLFVVSVIALVTAGIAASIRGNLADVLQHQFLDPIDPVHSAEMIGTILGMAFFGFALTIMIGSPLLDYLGMRFLLTLASFCFIAGTLILIFTAELSAHFSAYRVLWTGALISGIGWGLTETVINPLAVTLYPEDQTADLPVRLRILRADPVKVLLGRRGADVRQPLHARAVGRAGNDRDVDHARLERVVRRHRLAAAFGRDAERAG